MGHQTICSDVRPEFGTFMPNIEVQQGRLNRAFSDFYLPKKSFCENWKIHPPSTLTILVGVVVKFANLSIIFLRRYGSIIPISVETDGFIVFIFNLRVICGLPPSLNWLTGFNTTGFKGIGQDIFSSVLNKLVNPEPCYLFKTSCWGEVSLAWA